MPVGEEPNQYVNSQEEHYRQPDIPERVTHVELGHRCAPLIIAVENYDHTIIGFALFNKPGTTY